MSLIPSAPFADFRHLIQGYVDQNAGEILLPLINKDFPPLYTFEFQDAVLDPVGKQTLARSYGVVKKGGIVMSLVARPDPVELEKRGIRGASISVHPDADDLAEIAQLIDVGKIKPMLTQVLPLSEAIAAQQQAATHHTRGKVVLRIAEEPKG